MISRRRFLALGSGLLVASGCGGESSPSATRSSSTPRGLVSAWSKDRFAMGSYSYLKKGSTPDDRIALAAPVSDRIFFAGEATDSDFPATVHGAIRSGWRAADEVMEATDGTVLVIGAGAAGLAAASYLVEEDYDVVVLEGRTRIGGRLHTDTTTLGTPIDLGASWIHGVDGNPVLDYDLRTKAFDYDDYEVKGTETADFEYSTSVEHELGADERDLSPVAMEEGEELEGGDRLVVGGYQRLADQLAEDVDVELGVEVTEIALARSGVDVKTTTGTRHADAVVVTVPLGVLQAGRPRFTPALPATKSAAIKRLGMGVLSKTIVRFDDVFWDDVSMLGFPGRTPRTLWTEAVNLEPFTGKPILMVFSAGAAGRMVEAMKPADAIAGAADVVRGAYLRR